MTAGILLLFLAGAAYTDVREYKIKNSWLVVAIVIGFWVRRGAFLAPFMLTLLILFPCFLLRMFGAGDVKLIAVVFGYIGIEKGIPIVAITMILASVHAICKMIFKKSACARLRYLSAYIRYTIQTGQIKEYYSVKRDGYDAVIPLALWLFFGTAIVLCIG